MGAYLVQKGHIHAVFYSSQDRHLSVQNPQYRCPEGLGFRLQEAKLIHDDHSAGSSVLQIGAPQGIEHFGENLLEAALLTAAAHQVILSPLARRFRQRRRIDINRMHKLPGVFVHFCIKSARLQVRRFQQATDQRGLAYAAFTLKQNVFFHNALLFYHQYRGILGRS